MTEDESAVRRMQWCAMAMMAITALLPLCLGAAERSVPYRLDPVRTPAADGTTVLLWRFEDAGAADASAGGNDGRIVGSVTAVRGRHGKGLRFAGQGAITLKSLSNAHVPLGESEGVVRIVDFWCRPDKAPTQPACLLDLPVLGQTQLVLAQDMTLQIHHADTTIAAPKPLQQGVWTHVALCWQPYVQPNGVFPDGLGIELLINGVSAAVFDLPEHSTGRLPTTAQQTFAMAVSLGNNVARDAPFAGVIDEFRLSRGAAGVYPIVRQLFAPQRPDLTAKLQAAYFQQPDGRVYSESFDRETSLNLLAPPPHPVFLSTTPAVPQTATIDQNMFAVSPGSEDRELLEEMADELSQPGSGDDPLAIGPGVRGGGLLVRGGAARLAVAEPEVLAAGSLACWIAPQDWDNLAMPPGGDAFSNRRVHVLTLWGEPPSRDGAAVPLVSLAIDRAAGGRRVRPEHRRHFARPATPLTPHHWRHLVITWSDRFAHLQSCTLDGNTFPATFAPAAVWQTHTAAYITLGNGFTTAYDELQVFRYPLAAGERLNLRAEAVGESMKPPADWKATPAIESLGTFPVNVGESQLPRIAGDWLTGWVPGTAKRGKARTFYGFRPEAGALVVVVAPDDAAAIRAKLSLTGGGQTFTGTIPEFADGKGGVVLETGDMPVGEYHLSGTLHTAEGQSLGSFASTFRRVPVPAVQGNELGLLDTPPAPFTAVRLEGNTVHTVGRAYRIGPDANPAGLTIRGEDILAAPIRFETKLGDKATMLAGTGVRFGQHTPVNAAWAAEAAGAGLTVRSQVYLEYDGLARYALEIASTEAAVTVERLSLLIPLKAKYAQLFHVLGFNGGLRNRYVAGALRPGDGIVWDSHADYNARGLGQGRPPCQMWLGGVIRGLVWYADNDRGWTLGQHQPPMTVTRRGDTVTLAIHFIAAPCRVDEPRRIHYSLLGTPPKPLPKDHRQWNRGDLENVGPVAGRVMSCDAFAPWVAPPRDSTFAYWPRDDDWEYLRTAVTRQRQGDDGKYPPGQALMMYHNKNKTPLHPDMLAYYGWSWGTCRYPQARINHMIYYMDRMIECGYDGIYIDDVFPFGEWNLEPVGRSYLAADSGKKIVGSAAGAYRDYMKRLYNLFAIHGKRPIITTHMTSTLGWPYHTFVTVAYDHEHSARFSAQTSTFMDAWPLDYLMTLDIPERSGLVTIPMLKGKYLEDRSPLQKWAAKRSFGAVWMLFDLNMPLHRTPLAGYGGPDVDVYPFWRNQHIVSVTPQIKGPVVDRDLPAAKWWVSEHVRQGIGKQPLRATVYRRDRRALLIVANFLRRAVGAQIHLDLDALGVPAAARTTLRAIDVDKSRPPEDVDLALLHLADNKPTPMALPQIGNALPLAPTDDNADLLLDDPASAPSRTSGFYTVTLKDRTVSCQVAPHNYRALELQW